MANNPPVVSQILVVDDEPGFRALLNHELSKKGYRVTTATNGEEALEKVRHGKFDLAISDMKMPKLNGMEFLEALKKESPDIEVIMATGFGTIENAVSAMKKGAYDFIQKPFNLPEVFALIEKALEKRDLKALLGVYESSKAIFSSIKLDTLLPVIMQLALKILRSDDTCLFLKKMDGSLHMEASIGLDNDQARATRLAFGEKLMSQAAEWDNPQVVSDVPGVASALVCPLRLENEFLGVLIVDRLRPEDAFTAQDLLNVVIFGSQIAQAVYNARLYEVLEAKVQELEKAYGQLEETQLQLIQSEKLAAIGQLAAGVAHELNNPLTGILGFSQMALQNNDLPPQTREDIESIYAQSQRCRNIIQNLLQFSRRRKHEKEDVSVVALLNTTLQLVEYEFTTSNIEIIKDFVDDLPPIYADASQLQQVFLNILTNARHAMEGRPHGKLTLRAHEDNGKVVLTFTDNGCGIPKDVQGKIFDPFFTTKPVGKGTGLGLSISYGIIQQHHGRISAESQVGAGSTFIVELPAHRPNSDENENDPNRGR